MRIRRGFLSRSVVLLALLVSQMVDRGALAQSLPHLSLPAGAEAVNAAELGVDGSTGTGTARWVVTALRGQEILVAAGRDGQPEEATLLPSPPATGRLNREPLPLVEEGRLTGLVWLGGNAERALAVRYSRWNGSAWEWPQIISGVGPGSQLALTAARLGDGTWLLAWSAFDGQADEIVWSRQSPDGAWSAPLRVAAKNDVPDITPALTPLADGGALLAWSRFDGEAYRVMTARFADGKWTAPRFAGPSGSLFPSFEAATAGKWLLYQNAAPRGWSVAEIDAAGRTTRTAFLATPRSDRPVVSPATDRSGVTFRWAASGAPGAGREEENRATTWERP